jgi:methionine biosynthesis protein MetW
MLKRKDLQIISDIIEPNSRVLDLGCGDGHLLQELINEKNVKGLGIEISLERIKICLEHGISVVQEDLNEGLKDFQNNSFDFIVLSQTLEDISNPVLLIHEMLRVGKKCIISFENLAHWKNRMNFLFKGSLDRENTKYDILYNGKKQQILTVNKFLKFCEHYNFTVCKKVFLPKRRFFLSRDFPNVFSKTAIFILKGK